jgi:hypothetical protein
MHVRTYLPVYQLLFFACAFFKPASQLAGSSANAGRSCDPCEKREERAATQRGHECHPARHRLQAPIEIDLRTQINRFLVGLTPHSVHCLCSSRKPKDLCVSR